MKILLVGAGGYGVRYVRELLGSSRRDFIFEGIVDPYVSSSKAYGEISASGVPVYNTMEEFYSRHRADLAVICTPVFLHCEQSIYALKNGSCVLCEKPAAPTPEEVNLMLKAEKTHGRFVAIGYQWSFDAAILSLKKDILSGALGSPISMKSIVCWPRNFEYYRRGGGWAGRIERDGRLILDSIASNAAAHYIHNMLFLLGGALDVSAFATDIEADCFRANDIETFDTCSIRARANDVPIYLIASHATEKARDPEFLLDFEKATVSYCEGDDGGNIRALFRDGSEKCYGGPARNNNLQKLWDAVDAAKNGKAPVCTVKTAMAHTDFINKLHKTAVYRPFDKTLVSLRDDGSGVYVPGLYERIEKAYESVKLLSEI